MLKVACVGAALGFLGAIGIYFAPEEPYPNTLRWPERSAVSPSHG